MRNIPPLFVVLLVALSGVSLASQPLPAVVVSGEPVAPSPGEPGTGLCVASRISTNPSGDFPQSTASFNGGVNTFLETAPNTSNPHTRHTVVLRTPLDLSNNNPSPQRISDGDFVDAVGAWGCQSGGCGFFVNDTTTSFASRLRGYLNVTPELVGRTVHFGFYADDAVSLVIFDKNARFYEVVIRPPQLGAPTWRTTNSVTFQKAGLYPVEVLYAEITEHAALEASVLVGEFTDFEQQPSIDPINLRDQGFTLLEPASFYQSESGRPSFPDLNQCQQCQRQYANTAGNNGCDAGYYCNGASLCSPCDSAVFCGPSCSPCGASTPLCLNINGTFTCAQCGQDSDCPNGRCDLTTNECRGCNDDGDCKSQGLVCDLSTNECVACNVDADCPSGRYCDGEAHACRECLEDAHCPRGESCADNECRPCATKDSCAGTSCNCCPGNLQCASPTANGSPTCVECTGDADCADGKRCDTLNGRCVEQVAECNTPDRCGAQCVRCPTERPFCLDGQVCVTCRSDLECGDGKFCLSGECASCTTDKRCGARCEACAGDTPFCLTNGTTEGSTCVGCRTDAECGPGGTCDPTTRTCGTSTCAVSCTEGKVCHGTACVECFADAHCPCGGTCDTALNVCTTSCEDSSDCLGVEHCSPATQQCERGRRKPGTEPRGGAFCCGAVPDEDAAVGLAAMLLAAVALLLRSRRAV